MKNQLFKILSLFALCVSTQSFAQSVSTYKFSASSGTFSPINGTDTVTDIHNDTRLSNSIPIGFSFSYEGTTYTNLKASSNSFLTFNTSSTNSRTTNDLDNVNEAIIAPFWDDNDGRATGGSYASYATTGTSPNRVFTFEWLNWEWRYNSTTPTISCQVKLYETSNKIEFIYRPESGTVSSGTASAGLCGAGTGSGTFLSLNNLGTAPTVSSTIETTNISAKPASGQKYTFSPPTCLATPKAIRDTNTTANSTTIKFETTGTAGSTYIAEYGVTGSSTTTTTSGTTAAGVTSLNLSGLSVATDYTIHIKVVCTAGDTSSAATYDFSTVYSGPFQVDFSGFTGANLGSLFNGWIEDDETGGKTSSWIQSNGTQTTAFGKTTARINLYTNSRYDLIISPRLLATAADTFKFKVAVTDWNSSSTDVMGADDSVRALISVNGGYTWDLVKTYTRADNLGNSLVEYKMGLAAYAGKTIRVAFLATDGPIDNSEDYDFHVADVFLGSFNLKDFGVTTLLEPTGGCGNVATSVYAVVKNHGLALQNNIGVKVDISGQATASLNATISSLDSFKLDTVFMGTINTSTGGTYNFKSYTTLTGDQDATNDTLVRNGISFDSIPNAPTAGSIQVCAKTDTSITATGGSSGYRWYSEMTGGTLLSSDSTLNIVNPLVTDTFYVETFDKVSSRVGAANNSIGTGGTYTNFPDGLRFNAADDFVLDSVTVIPGSGGNVVLRLRNSAGTVVTSKTVNVSTGGSQTIAVGMSISKGNGYYLDAVGSTVSNFYRNSGGASYPYTESSGTVTITSAINNLASYYYFWYDWKISVNGCPSNRASAVVTIDTLPAISSSNVPSMCEDASPVSLSFASPTGGTYSGDAVNAGTFYPDSAVVGANTVIYEYTGGNGCSDTIQRLVIVNGLPTVSLTAPANLCLNDAPIKLTGGTPAGGVYTINGTIDSVLTPVSKGTAQVIYTYMDANMCINMDTADVAIDTVPITSFGTVLGTCIGSSPYRLTEGTPAGGFYLGKNVSGGRFYNLDSLRTDTLIYVYTDRNGCRDTSSQMVTVFPLPTVSLASYSSVCANVAPFSLSGGIPTGGTYTGNGIANNTFDPSAIGSGIDTVTYTYTDANKCANSAKESIEVLAAPVATISSISNVCDNDSSFTIRGISPAGGTLIGNGVSNGKFTPVASLVGSVTVGYVATNGSCSDTANTTFNVVASPVFNIKGSTEGCGEAGVQLSTDAPSTHVYKWSTGNSTPSISTKISGTIWVRVIDPTNSLRCSSRDTVEVTYEAECVGIDETLADAQISYYPNPTTGVVNYSFIGIPTENAALTVVNATGQTVYSEQLNGNKVNASGTLNLGNLENGIYLINLTTKKGMSVHRIVVNR